MAGSAFVDLTNEKPPKRDVIDLTASCAEDSNNAATQKINQPKKKLSDSLSLLENPPESKVTQSAKSRFAYKSSSAKNQPVIPKSEVTPKVDRDQPDANGTHQEPKIEPREIVTEPSSPQIEQHRLDQLLPNGKKALILETPPRIDLLNPAISNKLGSKHLDSSGTKDRENGSNEEHLEISSSLEIAQYDVESLEVSLEAYKTSLQKTLARVHNKHQVHVQQILSGVPSARLQRKSATNHVVTTLEGDLESPFGRIKTQQSIFLSKPKSSLQLGCFESFTGHRGKKHPTRVCMPRTMYSTSDDSLPLSDEYVSTNRNVLTGNEDFPTQVPFQGDYASIDNDYQDLESQILQNRAVHVIKLEAGEKAEFYQPHLNDILKSVGCSVTEVLYYLLDDTSPIAPSDLPTSLVSLWTDREMYLEDGYFSEADDSEHDSRIEEPGFRRPQKKWTELFKQLRRSATLSHKSATALVCSAFANLSGISIWQVLKIDKLVLSMVAPFDMSISRSPPKDGAIGIESYSRLACLSCFMHECPGHGELSWEDRENPFKDWNHLNAVPLKAQTKLRGMEKDKSISGRAWTKSGRHSSSFHDDEICSTDCYWSKENRREEMPLWSPEESDLFSSLLPAYVHAPRAPCILALALDKPCAEIFWAMLQSVPSSTPVVMREYNERAAPKHTTVRQNSIYWQENSETWRAEHRPPFIPCDHTGPCSELTNCSCFKNEVTCEKSCLCSSVCARRIEGCRCDGRFCGDKRYCECARLNRECDPDLCRKCGVSESLDPVHRHSRKSTKCRNSAIQRGVPCRTILGDSKMLADAGLKGWGLYAGESIALGDYVGEYTGEVISNEEGDRRGTIYDMRQMSYLFCLNKEQWIDSTYVGNKTRFINHQGKPNANVEPRVLLCNMVHRIGMFAKRNIRMGEELFFDYGSFFTRKFDLVAVQEREKTVLKNPREGLSVEKQKRGRKTKIVAEKAASKPLRSQIPSVPSMHKLTLRPPDPILSHPSKGSLNMSRKRMRKESSPVPEPIPKRRLVRTQFGKRNLDTESEYGETSHDGIGADGVEDEDEVEVSAVDEDSTGDVEEEIAEDEETESAEEPDEDEMSEEDLTPVRQSRRALPQQRSPGRPRKESRKGSHTTEAARRALAEQRQMRLSDIPLGARTRSTSGQVTPVPRTRSGRKTPDERPRASLVAVEDPKSTPRSGLLSKVARKGRK